MDKIMDKLLTTGISLAGGFAATKAFEFVWRQATGEETPKGADEDEISLRKALVFAISSSAISAGVQVLSQRGAKASMRKIKGAYKDPAEV